MTTTPEEPEGKRLGIVTDLDSCIGCQVCAVHCKDWNTDGHLSDLSDRRPIDIDPSGVWFNRVHAIECGDPPDDRLVHFPRSCLHCEIPACAEVCPTGAIFKRAEDGIVLVNENYCIGCKLCSWACPYGALEYSFDAGAMQKCTMCVDRIYDDDLAEADRVPVCVSSCPVSARHFGNLGDPDSAVSKLSEERGGYDLMPELGYGPVNKYLPPREHTAEAVSEGAPGSPAPLNLIPVSADTENSGDTKPRSFLMRLITGENPARPAIIFTTLSGAGYGILVWAAFFAFFGGVPPDRWFGLAIFATAFLLIGTGLFAAATGVGKPGLVWLAYTQWRSSWFSRLSVFSLAAFGPALVFALGWVVFESYGDFWRLMSGLTVFLSLGAVICATMVYASLRTVRAWFNPHTIRVFICMALWSGIVWFNMFAQLFSLHTPVIGIVLIIIGVATLIFKRKYWIFLDNSPSWVTPESATGLGALEPLRMKDGPTTLENYIHREMGGAIDRAQVEMLRRRSFLLYLLVPFCAATIPVEMEAWIRIFAASAGVVSVMIGIAIERWLFFAEAKHTAMLYYGSETS